MLYHIACTFLVRNYKVLLHNKTIACLEESVKTKIIEPEYVRCCWAETLQSLILESHGVYIVVVHWVEGAMDYLEPLKYNNHSTLLHKNMTTKINNLFNLIKGINTTMCTSAVMDNPLKYNYHLPHKNMTTKINNLLSD